MVPSMPGVLWTWRPKKNATQVRSVPQHAIAEAGADQELRPRHFERSREISLGGDVTDGTIVPGV